MVAVRKPDVSEPSPVPRLEPPCLALTGARRVGVSVLVGEVKDGMPEEFIAVPALRSAAAVSVAHYGLTAVEVAPDHPRPAVDAVLVVEVIASPAPSGGAVALTARGRACREAALPAPDGSGAIGLVDVIGFSYLVWADAGTAAEKTRWLVMHVAGVLAGLVCRVSGRPAPGERTEGAPG